MTSFLKSINNLQKFRDFLDTDLKAEYFRGRGRKVKGYSLNQLSYKLNTISYRSSPESIKLFNELKEKLRKIDQTSMVSLANHSGATKFEVTLAKIRQKLGNFWFKLTTRFDRVNFLNAPQIRIPSLIAPIAVTSQVVQDPLDVVVDHTEPFAKYQIPFRDKMGGLTAVNLTPANLFFQSLFKGSTIKSTRDFIDQKVEENPEGLVKVSAQGINDLSEVYGDNVYQLTYKEIQEILISQKTYTSSLLPLAFYQELKKVLKKMGDSILKGPLTLLELNKGVVKELLEKVDRNPKEYGFKNKYQFDRFKNFTIYEIGSMVVKTEDYYLFMDASGKIFTRDAGGKDSFRLINACGIRGIHPSRTQDSVKQTIMKETFKTALISAENGLVLFPAVGMGVLKGPPELYWPAFLDAVIETPDQFERIFVHPGPEKQGEEFQTFLEDYLNQYRDKPEILAKLQKIKNLLSENTDLLQLAHNLKQTFCDKTVSLFNASDLDEENYTAMGTKGLCFEEITD